MWRIKHIFDGDFGCEERAPGQEEMTVSVTLENGRGEIKYVTVTDAWLTEQGLDEGSIWPEREGKSNVKGQDVGGNPGGSEDRADCTGCDQ